MVGVKEVEPVVVERPVVEVKKVEKRINLEQNIGLNNWGLLMMIMDMVLLLIL